MVISGEFQDGDTDGMRSAQSSFVKRVFVFLAAIIGSIAGGLIIVPLWITTPYWVFLTLPQLIGAVYASSVAYLVTGPYRRPLSRAILRTMAVAILLSIINLALFTGLVPGIASLDDLALPGGLVTHLLEAIVIGVVAWMASVQKERVQNLKLLPGLVALFASTTAIAVLLIVGSSVLPVLFAS